MTRLEPAETIEATVGALRHPTDHIGRFVIVNDEHPVYHHEKRIYILHPQQCLDTTPDLRTCEFSEAADKGIDDSVWDPASDRPVILSIDVDCGRLEPWDWA